MQEGFVGHIYYKIVGEGEPLMMISGLGADHLSWSLLASHLSDYFKIILFDNRGIGKSSIPDDGKCTIDKMVEDVSMLLNALNIKKANIIGHSLGGYVAQEFSAKYPEKILKLILLSSKLKSRPVQKLYLDATINMMKQNISRNLMIKNSLCWLFSNFYLENPQNIHNFINNALQKPLEETRTSYLYQVNAVLNFDTSLSAGKIISPTLIITGEQDILVTLQDAKDLNNLIKNSILKIVEKMGHMSHIEIPDKIAKKILEFI